MDYLRRLHPAHADRSSAARLDLPAAPAAAAATLPATFDGPGSPLHATARAAPADATPIAANRESSTEPAPRAAPLTAVAAATAQPLAAPHRPSVAAPPPQAMRLARPALPPRTLPPLIDAVVPAPLNAAPPLRRADARSSPAARQPEPSAVAVALQPLRAEAVRERDRGAASEPAPIIHVTIDRIDVRLPSTAATPPAPARRRAAPTVAALGDYLRGRAPEDRA